MDHCTDSVLWYYAALGHFHTVLQSNLYSPHLNRNSRFISCTSSDERHFVSSPAGDESWCKQTSISISAWQLVKELMCWKFWCCVIWNVCVSGCIAQGTSQTMNTLKNLVDKGVKVELGIPYELWDEPSVEVADMKKQVKTSYWKYL